MKIFLFVIVIFVTKDSYGQFKNFGIKGGINISNAKIITNYTDDYVEYPSMNNTGFDAIIFYDFFNLKYFGLSVEAGYSSRGFEEEVIENNEYEEIGRFIITNSLNYVDISFLGELIFRNEVVSPYINLGLVLAIYQGYKTSASKDRDQNYVFGENNILLSKLNSTLGFKLGVGAEINKVTPQILIIEMRYFEDLGDDYYSLRIFKKNTMLEFNIGIKFK